MRSYRFFAHFNRINMQRGNPNVWTIHFRGRCIQCQGLEFKVPTFTTYTPNSQQPRAKIRGSASRVRLVRGVGVVE